jgi:hypothetical protein
MMPGRLAPAPIDAVPLFVAGEIAQLDRLAAQRDELKAHIARLPPNAHRRVILQSRLGEVVLEILKLEAQLYRSAP